ncbi:MAG: AraC family transcriptional regulator [Flammeovirgaceae bacterium]|nr:AraC family transcriptional regulator [Flammeovirgaceae bacterium]
MHYQKIQPAESLRPWVECFYEWTGHVEKELDVQSPPNRYAAMIFNLGNSYNTYQGNVEKTLAPKTFACGLFTTNYHLVLQGTIDIFGIVFKPNGFHNFFGMRMSHLVNSRVDLSLLIEESPALHQSIADLKTGAERAARMDTFLLDRLPQAQANATVIDDAVDYINQCKGLVSVTEVAEKFNISKRYLEKQFLIKVGISPKFYCRIIRFVYLSNIVAHNANIDWQEIVNQFGLHDQSHLVKEFMEFNQMSPSHYHQNHNEMTRILPNQINMGEKNDVRVYTISCLFSLTMNRSIRTDLNHFLKALVQALKPIAKAEDIDVAFLPTQKPLNAIFQAPTLAGDVTHILCKIIEFTPEQEKILVGIKKMSENQCKIQITNTGINLVLNLEIVNGCKLPVKASSSSVNSTQFEIEIDLFTESISDSIAIERINGPNFIPDYYAEIRKRLRSHFNKSDSLVETLLRSNPREAAFLKKVNELIVSNMQNNQFMAITSARR